MYNLGVIYSRESQTIKKSISYYHKIIEQYKKKPNLVVKDDCTSTFINLGFIFIIFRSSTVNLNI
jgi:hypothetical protein